VAQNGSGVANTIVEEYDIYGYLIRTTDERGVVTEYENETSNGAVKRTTQDVGGLSLVIDYENDAQGRMTESLGPLHEIDLNGVPTMIRRSVWTVYKDFELEIHSASGFQNTLGNDTLVNPVRISKTNGDGQPVEQIAAVRASTSGKLVPTDAFPQSRTFAGRQRSTPTAAS
jgi:hypothetical protein